MRVSSLHARANRSARDRNCKYWYEIAYMPQNCVVSYQESQLRSQPPRFALASSVTLQGSGASHRLPLPACLPASSAPSLAHSDVDTRPLGFLARRAEILTVGSPQAATRARKRPNRFGGVWCLETSEWSLACMELSFAHPSKTKRGPVLHHVVHDLQRASRHSEVQRRGLAQVGRAQNGPQSPPQSSAAASHSEVSQCFPTHAVNLWS